MNESQSKENQAEQTAHLADLDPKNDVVGGAGFAYAVLTVGGCGRQTTGNNGATLQVQGDISVNNEALL